MGYSCSANADESMREIQSTFSSKSNFWEDDKGKEFFFEIGRENYDGSITGSVFDAKGYRKGAVKIEPNGYITKFPHLSKNSRNKVKEINNEIRKVGKERDREADRGVDEYLKSRGIE